MPTPFYLDCEYSGNPNNIENHKHLDSQDRIWSFEIHETILAEYFNVSLESTLRFKFAQPGPTNYVEVYFVSQEGVDWYFSKNIEINNNIYRLNLHFFQWQMEERFSTTEESVWIKIEDIP